MSAIQLDEIATHLNYRQRHFIVLYADDILILAPTVCELQRLLTLCELELSWLDLSMNVNKSCCMRIGPQFDAKCANITISSGHALPWVKENRYLGIFITSFRYFKCALDHAKRKCYGAINSILGKIGDTASAEVILEIISKKCWPILLYGLKACPVTKSGLRSLDFIATRLLMKMFRTSNNSIVNDCANFLRFSWPSELLSTRTTNFLAKYKMFIESCCFNYGQSCILA